MKKANVYQFMGKIAMNVSHGSVAPGLVSGKHQRVLLTGLGVVFFAKPLVDMFWNVTFLDYVLLGYSIILLILSVPKIKEMKLYTIDGIVLLMATLIVFSILRNPAGLVIGIKMLSSVLMYFIGRLYWEEFSASLPALKVALGITVLCNLVLFLFGIGFQMWGQANTFSGLYYFKTDLACAMCLALFVFLYWGKNRPLAWIVVIVSGMLIVFSNTRAYYIIIGLSVFLYLCEKRGIEISIRFVLILTIAFVALLFSLNYLSTMPLLKDMGFVAIRFDSISDLFNSSNTQGRNVIWSHLFERIAQGDSVSQLFGFDLVSDVTMINGGSYGSHSLYVGMLFNTGIVGLLCVVAFLIYIFVACRRNSDRRLSYFFLSILVMFAFNGVSVHVLQYTGNSWLPLIFFGIAVSMVKSQELKLKGICVS